MEVSNRNQVTLTTTELLCWILGWQGGTIHQVASELGMQYEDDLILDTNSEDFRSICIRAQQRARWTVRHPGTHFNVGCDACDSMYENSERHDEYKKLKQDAEAYRELLKHPKAAMFGGMIADALDK